MAPRNTGAMQCSSPVDSDVSVGGGGETGISLMLLRMLDAQLSLVCTDELVTRSVLGSFVYQLGLGLGHGKPVVFTSSHRKIKGHYRKHERIGSK